MSNVADAVALLESEGVVFREENSSSIVAEASRLEELSPECVKALDALRARTPELLVFLRGRDGDLPPQNSYAAAFLSAVRRAIPPDFPSDAMAWLREAQPHLHGALTQRIPDLIQLLWESGAPSGDFDDALAELVEGYRRALGFYRACHAG